MVNTYNRFSLDSDTQMRTQRIFPKLYMNFIKLAHKYYYSNTKMGKSLIYIIIENLLRHIY